MKLFLLLFFLVSLAFSQVSGSCPENCPDTEEVVWALGYTCNVYRNKCYFDKAKCGNPELQITTMEECQKNCANICPAIYQPTSGIYNGKIQNFSNECVKNAYTCRTGETFL